ncbi:Ubiquitin Carboxyl-Terminal Hydrolase 6 [Manis pentadactyla]|nr:Ubiquitin Carboxyl-Terminal Hydrolase 6 [Manis pentadactyla]
MLILSCSQCKTLCVDKHLVPPSPSADVQRFVCLAVTLSRKKYFHLSNLCTYAIPRIIATEADRSGGRFTEDTFVFVLTVNISFD